MRINILAATIITCYLLPITCILFFYLKNGFREAGYSTREYGVEYEMLYLGGNVSYEEFLALIRKYFGRTLALMVKKNFKKA